MTDVATPSAPTLAQVLGAIEQATGSRPKQHGDQYMALCPAHHDERESLAVTAGKDGLPLLYCHAGCEYAAIYKAIGISAPPRRKAKPKNERREVARYTYRDEQGNPLFVKVRFEPKSFTQERPDGSPGIDGVRRVLYRLPETLEAIKAGQPIYVVEGEKDADTLAAWGLAVTTNPEGAGKWLAEYTETLGTAVEVFVIPDNDTVGRSHAADVVASLEMAGVPVRLLPLPGARDVAHWAEQGGTRTDLEVMVARLGKHAEEEQAPADLKALGRTLGGAVFEPFETDETSLARRLLSDLEVWSGTTPVVSRGCVAVYDRARGVWLELDRTDIASLVHCYSGANVETVNRQGEVTRTRLKISSNKASGTATAALRSLAHQEREFFERAPAGVAMRNGFVTVSKNGITFTPHSPANRALFALPINYDLEAECPQWIDTLRRVFDRDESKALLLQEFVGACLAGVATNYAACLVMIGEGANGKSVIAETIAEQLFPPEVVTYSAPQSWSGRFSTARLRNSRLNVAAELPDADIQATDVFKTAVDGGCIEVEQKGVDPYSIRPKAGHLFLTNVAPTTRDNSEGFWRRFLMLRFEHDFRTDADQETKEAVKARLATEASGIMLWALHGAVRLMRDGKYALPASHAETLDEVRKATDSVASFLEECCRTDHSMETPSSAVHEAFCRWAERSKRHPLSNKVLALRLKSCGVFNKRTKSGRIFGIEVLPSTDWSEGKTA